MIGANDYKFLCTLLRNNSGLALGAGKEYLLESRLPAVVAAYGFASLAELVQLLRTRPHQDLVKAVCDAMTTNETLFFRDGAPFDLLRDHIFPQVVATCRERGAPVRIWSAAASTGQEPFSVAMLIAEMEGVFRDVPVEILATDYAAASVNRAKRAVYSEFEVQRGLSPARLKKHFTPVEGGYQLHDQIRRRVRIREFNLLDSCVGLGRFDVILCRNVLIYFDQPSKKDVVERLADVLLPGGYLFLGGTETSFGVTDRIVRLPGVAMSVHMRREDAAAAERMSALLVSR